jgi:serine/threonine-protein kinase
MGVVYKARQTKLDRIVALKMIRSGRFADAEEVRRFQIEAEAAAQLDHPNIVPIYETGELEGHAYFSMKLVKGGSLAESIERFVQDPPSAVRLMVTLALAVRYAHQRGILHRDLKPANILLDDQGRPYIMDFGLAKRVEMDSGLTKSGVIIGTARYMSPEQAGGESKRLTWAADVYSLGAILYELLTGRPPFQGATLHETLLQVVDQEPVAPSACSRLVDRDLETICLKCLEKDPERRYQSAKALANDLELWLSKKPIRARRIGMMARAWRWCRRKPFLSSLMAATAVLFLVASIVTDLRIIDSLRAPGRAQQALAWQGAKTIRIRLSQLGEALELAASNPELGKLLRRGDVKGLQRFIVETGNRRVDLNGQSPFESWFVVDMSGALLARWPRMSPETKGVDFRSRDYFKGALRREGRRQAGGRESLPPYFSKVYRARSDRLYKFGISRAVRDGGGIVGVVVASVTTSRSMGLPKMEGIASTTALLARMDPFYLREKEREKDPDKGRDTDRIAMDNVILLHPAYDYGICPVGFPEWPGVAIRRGVDGDYRDPLARRDKRYGGRWLAGFAEVPGTDFVVIAQRRYEEVLPVELWGAVAVAIPAILAIVAIGFLLRRKARPLSDGADSE